MLLIWEYLLVDGWQSRWVKSDWKRSEGKAGSFRHTAGRWSGDPDDKGISWFYISFNSTNVQKVKQLTLDEFNSYHPAYLFPPKEAKNIPNFP